MDCGGFQKDCVSINLEGRTDLTIPKKVSLDVSSEDIAKSLLVPISRRRSDTSAHTNTSSSPLKRKRSGSLAIFPNLQMITRSPSGSLNSRGIQEFDTSEMFLFLSQGAK